MNDEGRKSFYSDFGDAVDISAPSDGGNTSGVFTTDARGEWGYNPGDVELGDPQGDYTNDFGGTSSAAPVVAGVGALVIAMNPMLTVAEVRDILLESADPIDPVFGRYVDGHSPIYGAGRVNAYRAVRLAEIGCALLSEELCNGVDDTCDGEVDEGCSGAAACEVCAMNADCASGICARLPNDVEGRCVEPCEAGCGSDESCVGGVCAPLDGRCADCADEACDGLDNDCDGDVDEDGVCPEVGIGFECEFDGECGADGICADGYCYSTCDADADCMDGAQCEETTGRYGVPQGVGICVVPAPDCAELLCTDQWYDAEVRESTLSCLDGVLGDGSAMCESVEECLPPDF